MRAYLTKDLGEAETPRDPGLAQLCAGVEGRAWLGFRDSGSRGDTVEKRGVPGLVPAASYPLNLCSGPPLPVCTPHPEGLLRCLHLQRS